MRVCVLIDAWEPIWGGGQTHVWEVAKRLTGGKYNYVIDIFTRSVKENDNAYNADENYNNGRINIFRIWPVTKFFSPFGRYIWLFTVILAVWRHHRQKAYHVIHAHAYSAGIPGKILSHLLGIPIVFTVHGSNQLDLGKSSFSALLEKIILTKIKYDREISVSYSFLQHSNVNKNISVISNGVDSKKFARIKRPKPDKNFKLLWVGRFDRVKGVDILLKAFKLVVLRKKRARLSLVGYGYEIESMKRLAKELNIDKYVDFLGRQAHTDLIKIYKSANLFILPSLSEGQPITLLEAMAARLPVVASDVGDNSLVVENNKNGYLIKPQDHKLLAETIMRAINNSELKTLGINGYKKVGEHYSWDKSVQKLHEVYTAYVS